MSKDLEFAIRELEELDAVLIVEYHNKNWLKFDGGRLNIARRRLVKQIKARLEEVVIEGVIPR